MERGCLAKRCVQPAKTRHPNVKTGWCFEMLTDPGPPSGRPLSACQRAIGRLRERHNFPPLARPPGMPENIAPPPKQRKRQSAGDLSTPSQVATQFTSFPSVNNPSPGQGLQSPGGKMGKKRGRPSKADHELRAMEAAARGEPYPPPKKARPPKPPADQGGLIATAGASGDDGALGLSENSG